MPLEAVIFDMDGVLSDTQRLHAQAQSQVLKNYDVEMPPEEITRKYAGREPGTLFRQETDTNKPMEAHAEKQELLHQLVENNGVEKIEGAKKLVKNLHEEYCLAVASSSQPEFIQKVVSDLELEDYFDCIESASEVENGKPAPDVFLKAAEDLGVEPENCIVIEDGRSGMKGAREAGMVCIGLVNGKGDYPAHETVESLKELDRNYMQKLHKNFRS
ncbi:MAG: beta-phosphoglucomutase family hydrolase [Candidatus Nanohaloarchaea archaeon]|jgi:beta-phosphoglucomutase family hydrolase